MSPEPPARLALEAGDLQLDLVPRLGGAVAGYRWRRGGRATPLFRESPADAADVLQTASFPLVPYCNRIRDGRFAFRGRHIRLTPNLAPQRHPLHGQGWRAAWMVAECGTNHAELVYRHEPGEWPWAYEARQRFLLEPSGLEHTLACRNLSDQPMPCGLGFHPFFDAPPDTVLDAHVSGVWTIDAEIMPVALRPPVGRYSLASRAIAGADLDNGYEGWSGEATIRWPSRRAGVRILSKAPRFQVFAPADQPVLCAEPVTNANDALSRPEGEWEDCGVTVLEPDEQTALSARFEPLGDA